MIRELQEINFSDLRDLNDSNSIVYISCLFRDEDIPEFEKYVHDIGLCSPEKKVTGIHFIKGNVRGDARKGADSRADWVITFDRPDLPFNPMVRLRYGSDFKWTSDFIDNFRNDYKV